MTDLKNQLAAKAEGGAERPTVYDLLKKQEAQIAVALPKAMNAERFTRIVLTECRRTPRLLACTPDSLLGAVMLSAQLGLEPGPLGHCYLVPFRNKGTLEVQFIIGYKGLIDLARRSGNIESIVAREVCEHDEFQFEYGLDEKLIHRPSLNNRGDAIAYYGVARYRDGGHTMLVMSLDDIGARRARSKAKDAGPWVSDPAAMSLKTVIRAMSTYLPLSIEAAQALVADELVTTAIRPDILDNITPPDEDDVIDVEGTEATDATEPPADPEPKSDAEPPPSQRGRVKPKADPAP